MEITGVITKILPLQTGAKKDGSGDWKKQLFILDSKADYNNIYCFEIFGDDKVENFNKYNKVNDTVKVDFNVKTNEYQGKYFTTLDAWKVFKENNSTSEQKPPFEPAGGFVEEEHDDMPF